MRDEITRTFYPPRSQHQGKSDTRQIAVGNSDIPGA